MPLATGENEDAAELASSMVRRGISAGVAGLCYEFGIDLNQIEANLEDVIQNTKRDSDLESLISFGDTLREIKELAQQNLQNSLTNEKVRRIMSLAQGHSLFNIPSLYQWLSFKKSELEATKNLTVLKGNTFLGRAKLFVKKYVLVLSDPPFYQVTNKILSMMTGSIRY